MRCGANCEIKCQRAHKHANYHTHTHTHAAYCNLKVIMNASKRASLSDSIFFYLYWWLISECTLLVSNSAEFREKERRKAREERDRADTNMTDRCIWGVCNASLTGVRSSIQMGSSRIMSSRSRRALRFGMLHIWGRGDISWDSLDNIKICSYTHAQVSTYSMGKSH